MSPPQVANSLAVYVGSIGDPSRFSVSGRLFLEVVAVTMLRVRLLLDSSPGEHPNGPELDRGGRARWGISCGFAPRRYHNRASLSTSMIRR